MLDMGFKPQVDRIVRRVPSNRQTMFFSATLDGEVGELARAYTSSPSRFSAELPADRAVGEIEHRFVSVDPSTKVETLVEHLEASTGLTLVFVRTKRGADRLVQRLGATASRRTRSTATCPSPRAGARSTASRAGRSPSSSPPTSPPAASTSTTSST